LILDKIPVAVLSKEHELLSISRDKWRLMAEKNVDSLAMLFNEKAIFVHMGATMTKEQELGVIKVGGNEVVNPFSVTEVYVQENGKWSLASLSFTKLLVPQDSK
jgi:4-carboxymuconolactone decarboxylase